VKARATSRDATPALPADRAAAPDAPTAPHAEAFDPAAHTLVPAAFFARSPEIVAPVLLGCIVATCVDGVIAAGVIVETEAYLGADDAGSHAATKGITARNAVMYGPPGVAYVYFTYGNHHMLNLVCEPPGVAGAVLVRALRPVAGLAPMTSRRRGRTLRELTNGPGKLASALGIDLSDNGTVLGEGRISVYYGEPQAPERVVTSGRVGLTRGHDLQLRYFVDGDSFVSHGRTGPPPRTRGTSASQGGTT
jgi:DNA-3-methyladenine glycosylase